VEKKSGKKIIEFLIGFFLVPMTEGLIFFAIIMFVIPHLNLDSEQLISYSTIIMYIIKAVILILLFLIRKMVAIGYLSNIIFELISGIAIQSLVGFNVQ